MLIICCRSLYTRTVNITPFLLPCDVLINRIEVLAIRNERSASNASMQNRYDIEVSRILSFNSDRLDLQVIVRFDRYVHFEGIKHSVEFCADWNSCYDTIYGGVHVNSSSYANFNFSKYGLRSKSGSRNNETCKGRLILQYANDFCAQRWRECRYWSSGRETRTYGCANAIHKTRSRTKILLNTPVGFASLK